MKSKDGRIRKNVTIGSRVQIVQKQDQKNGHLTTGIVETILTSAEKHPHGIKVSLKSGKVGRIQKILSINETTETASKDSMQQKDAHLIRFPFLRNR